ncbi:septation ring formation regulator EzrA [Neobacillus sp. SM06]|uniref:septation ring formation regulator EzrA n=1 Tax=Neobacillus sp. SM06 TaxID=3422492 RepID=UPI003D29CFE7
MKYIIGFIILLLVIIVTGYFIKKKYYREMDRLEAWKIDLINRPVLDEMSKVKQLNMTGQTEELFERWRSEWDDIVTVRLPDLEELLFDAEEHIDRYRFRKAKEVQYLISKNLQETEDQIKRILNELNELVGSEEKNRVEIEQLRETYREAKKELLAHRYTFGKAEKQLESQLNDVIEKIQEFDDKTENGNYLQARETVLSIKSQLELIQSEMEQIPDLLHEFQTALPSQLTDVRDGFREMEQQGYYLEHIEVEKELSELEKLIAVCLNDVEQIEVDKAAEGLKDIKARIDVLFDLLEKEVHAKHYIIQNEKETEQLLLDLKEGNSQLNDEVNEVGQSYHLTDEFFQSRRKIEKELHAAYKRFEHLAAELEDNDTAQTVLKEELAEIKEQLDAVRNDQEAFFTKLHALRKDEMEAREKIQELRKKIAEAIRLVSKSNIPGLPDDYVFLFEESKESIENVKKQLEEKPLNISAINQFLEIAVLTVEKLVATTTELIDNAFLAEKVIQYGNRYRGKYSSVSKGLEEAEELFRSYDYHKALEQAAATIEAVDSEALRKIEALFSKD